MLRFLLFVVFLLAGTGPAAAQPAEGQPHRWLFGNGAGLDFSAGAPQPLAGAALNAVEGSAVACDAAGNLLFYTDGQRVWDRTHRRMPNGQNLGGSPNAAQSALVARLPGSDSLWYVFTTDFQGREQGLRLSVVSTARRGGAGDVIRKNELLFAPVAEMLTAVRHANGRDLWVIAHRWNSPQFLSLLLTPDGVQQPPVLSTAGSMLAGPGRNAIGYLVASPNGRRLAVSHWRDANKFEVLDFDRLSGEVNGRVALEPYVEAYGVAFSPDGTKIYGTANSENGDEAVIWQFDLQPGPGSDPEKYHQIIGRSRSRKLGALMPGPDGRLYVAREGARFLGVIAAPNQPGPACQYQDDGVPLGDGKCRLGLPNVW